MPCGGIYPLTHHFAGGMLDRNNLSHSCLFCSKSDPPVTHFVDEWDAYLHRACILPFLETKEGEIVLRHGHEVILYGEMAGELS